ncbi:hypothetical protein BH24CHL9_BH24CHL9_12830 [soil metagenome]
MRRPELPRTRTVRPIWPLLLALAVVVAAGGTAVDATAPDETHPPGAEGSLDGVRPDALLEFPLEGTRWRLVGHRLDDGLTTVSPEVAARLTLVGGRARAGVGCGPVRASYSLVDPPTPAVSLEPVPSGPIEPAASESLGPSASASPRDEGAGSTLRFEGIQPSERPCPVPTAAVGDALIEGLAASSRYVIEPGSEAGQATLRIQDAAGLDVLAFRVDDASSLPFGQWLLPIAGTDPAVLSFDPRSMGRRSRGRVLGSTGCNSISASYELQGSSLELRGLETSDLACAPSIAAQEAAVLALLRAEALVVELPAGRLILRDPRSGERLVFTSERPLEGPTWQLTGLGDRDLPDLTVTLRLEGGTVSGEGPCVPYAGTYRTNGPLIELSDLQVDEQACPRRGYERAFLRALRQTAFVDMRGPDLILQDAAVRAVATLRRPGAL